MDPLEDSALEGYIAFHFVPVEGVVIVTIDTGAVKFAGDIGYNPCADLVPDGRIWQIRYSICVPPM